MELLDCPLCLFLMCEPVSLSCGHTFCRRCVAGCFLPAKCPLCHDHGGHTFRQREVKSSRNNVLLISVVEKCCPGQTKTWSGVQDKLKAGEFTEALHIVNQGLDLVPDDVSLKALRAEANMGMLRYSDALTDLHYLCCLRPDWTEGFFRKGNVLLAMGQQTQALVQFHRCLNLQADFTPAKSQIKKVLEAEGVPVPDELSSLIQLLGEYLKEPCAITSLSVSQGPAHPEGPTQQHGAHGDEEQMKQESECCLSLSQAVSFLPAAEDHHDMMDDGHGRGESSHHGDKPLSVLSVSDFECPLCIRLFYEPVTTPCGHTFCKNCIERSLDHNLRCPLCKQPLQEYLKNRRYNPTALLQDIISRLFSSQLAERKHIHETEMAELSNLTKDIPIFVCTVAYPGVPCPLHIFEPRYRLMMRRCMETGTKKFGMCSYEHGKGFADYGCMLEIHSLELLADGRSFVDTTGGSRFKVLRRAQRDGYHTADIEYLEDLKVEGSELELLQHLHASVYQQAQDWYQRIGSRIRQQIDRQYGTMPETEENIQASSSGPAWCWWLLSVLQLDPAYQTTVLSLTSLKERLGHLRLVLEYFSQSES